MAKSIFFTPGPAQLFYSVPFHIKKALDEDIPSISHRSPRFQEIFAETRNNLSQLLELPSDYQIFFTGSATEAWERIYQNLVIKASHHFVNGSFSRRFYQFGLDLQFTPSLEVASLGNEFNSFDIPGEAELIGIAMNETSAGYSFDINRLKEIRTSNPNKLIALDVVSITPSVPIDFGLVDTAYFSVQKCFGLPAGLGVWIVGPRAIEKSIQKSKNTSIGTYHSIPQLLKYAEKNQTPETPNVLSIFLLNEVCKDMLGKGIQQIRNETNYKAALLYGMFERMENLSPFIPAKENRSKTVCVGEVHSGQEELLKKLKDRGMILGKGYGEFKDKHIRIANFPTHSKEQMEMLVDLIEGTL